MQKFRCITTSKFDRFVKTSQIPSQTPSNSFLSFLQNIAKTCSSFFTSFLSQFKQTQIEIKSPLCINNKKLQIKKAKPVTTKTEESKAQEKSKLEQVTTEERKTEEKQIFNCCRKDSSEGQQNTAKEKPISNPSPTIYSCAKDTKETKDTQQTKKTTEVVYAEELKIPEELSYEPEEFIDKMWQDLKKALEGHNNKDARWKAIKEFLVQPEISNRLDAYGNNEKIEGYFKKVAKKDAKKAYKKACTTDGTLKKPLEVFNDFCDLLGLEGIEIKCNLDVDLGEDCNGVCRTEGSTITISISENLQGAEKYPTMYHELIHVKQRRLVDMVIDGQIEEIDKEDSKEKFRCLSALLAQCQFDCSFSNGCDPKNTIQLSSYDYLNNEVEAKAYGEALEAELQKWKQKPMAKL